MDESKRDKTKVDPLTGGEERAPAGPLDSVPEGQTPSASTAVIPGTGEVIRDADGQEAKRVVRT